VLALLIPTSSADGEDKEAEMFVRKDDLCMKGYRSMEEVFFGLSTVSSSLWWGSQHDVQAKYQRHVIAIQYLKQYRGNIHMMKNNNVPEAIDSTDPEQELTAYMFSHAEANAKTCHLNLGSRYWDVRVDLHDLIYKYAAAYPEKPKAEWIDEFRRLFKIDVSMFDIPKEFRTSICAPAICDIEQVEGPVLLRHLELHGLPPISAAIVKAEELARWSQVDLDFIIGGVDRCGTTSLYMNMRKHPDIKFHNDTEFFSGHRVLPLRSKVEEFNGVWKGNRPRIIGLDIPACISRVSCYNALSYIEKLRVLMIICDPVDRFEKKFFNEVYCHGNDVASNQKALKSGDLIISGRFWPDCATSIGDALSARDSYLFEEWQVAKYILDFAQLVGSRLMLVHQDEIVEERTSRYRYGLLARLVGAKRHFSKRVKMGRYNSRRGHRTDLCQNRTLLNTIKQRLGFEYRKMAELVKRAGQNVPPALMERQTRCDRPEKLRTDRVNCNGFRRCKGRRFTD